MATRARCTFGVILLIASVVHLCSATVAGEAQMDGTPIAGVGPGHSPNTDEVPPYPLPTQFPVEGDFAYTSIAGIEDVVARRYELSTDPDVWIDALVADFDTAKSAVAAAPIYVDRVTSRLMQDAVIPTTVESVDLPVPRDFDWVFAQVFTRELGNGETQYRSEIVATRGDRLYGFVRTSYQPGFDGSIVELLRQVVLNPLPRDGATWDLTFGLWGELPILAEVPNGYVLGTTNTPGNYVPRSFGPIPPPTTP